MRIYVGIFMLIMKKILAPIWRKRFPISHGSVLTYTWQRLHLGTVGAEVISR